MKTTARLALILLIGALGTPQALAALDAPGCRLIRGGDTPDDPSDDVTVCRQDVWFHQAPQSKVGNLGATGQAAFPSWNTTKPAVSVTGGAGGGYVGHWVGDFLVEEYAPETTATFDGTYTGNIDNLAVTLYLFSPADSATSDTQYHFRTQLVVDGNQLYNSDFGNGDLVKISSGGQAVLRIDYAFVDVFGAMQETGLAGDDKAHNIRLSVTPYFPGDEAMYVYDTSEVPSGMIFNLEPESLGSYTPLSVAPPEEG